jgi:hypothetical protein
VADELRGRRPLWPVVLLAAAALAAPAAFAAPATPAATVPGILPAGPSYRLLRIDPVTFVPAGGPSVLLPAYSDYAISPDRRRAAFASPGTLRLVDLTRPAVVGKVKLEGFAGTHVVWPSRRTIFVFDEQWFAAVDARTLRIRWRKATPAGPFVFAADAATPSMLVFLRGPSGGRLGPTRLVTVDLSGHVRSVAVARIQVSDGDTSGGTVIPGLAVDPHTQTAYVVAVDGTVASVDLSSLEVSYHAPARRLSRAAKAVSGPVRIAKWLGGGLVAVTGANGRSWTDDHGVGHLTTDAAGLEVVDTRSWTTRVVDPAATDVVVSGRLLVTAAVTSDSAAGATTTGGEGIGVYGLDGTAVFHLLGTAPVADLHAAYGLVYAWSPDPSWLDGTTTVIDPSSGAVLGTPGVTPTSPTPTPLGAF